MSEFEFVFSLFGLLLGLSLVELLGGLARTIEAEFRERRTAPAPAERTFRAGWLTPLLGLFVMLDILTFWAAAWSTREYLGVTGPVLLGGLLFAGSYYLAAHLVFPREVHGGAADVRIDLDAHYFEVRRVVLGAMFLLAAVQVGFYLTLPAMAARLREPAVVASIAGLAILLIAAILVRGKAASAAILGVLIARYVYLSVT